VITINKNKINNEDKIAEKVDEARKLILSNDDLVESMRKKRILMVSNAKNEDEKKRYTNSLISFINEYGITRYFNGQELCDALFKIIVIGKGIGKEILPDMFCNRLFKWNEMDVGINFLIKKVKIKVNEERLFFKLQVWDVLNDERFKNIRSSYLQGASGLLLIFDLESLESFKNLQDQLNSMKLEKLDENIPILLLGFERSALARKEVSVEDINNFTSIYRSYYMKHSLDDIRYKESLEKNCFIIMSCLAFEESDLDLVGTLVKKGVIIDPGSYFNDEGKILERSINENDGGRSHSSK